MNKLLYSKQHSELSFKFKCQVVSTYTASESGVNTLKKNTPYVLLCIKSNTNIIWRVTYSEFNFFMTVVQ